MDEMSATTPTSTARKTGTPHRHVVMPQLDAYVGVYQEPCVWNCDELCCDPASFGGNYAPAHKLVLQRAEKFLCLRRVTEKCSVCRKIHRGPWKFHFRRH